MNFHENNAHVTGITLNIKDLNQMKHFYINILGMKLIKEDKDSFIAGFHGTTHTFEFNVLKNGRNANINEAGLFHIAILLPERADLGRFIKHTIDQRLPISGGDHLVSEAVYLIDPEGNGIEVYIDRDKDTWTWNDNLVAMDTLPLDFEGIITSSGDTKWQGMPNGTIIGHLHLKGKDLEHTDFYSQYGYDVVSKIRGARFMSSDNYHHHIAVNIWQSNTERIDSENTYGLKSFHIVSPKVGSGTVRTPEGLEMYYN